MVGSEIRTMFVSIAAIRVATVVFERTFHLYCIAGAPPDVPARSAGDLGRAVWGPALLAER